MKQRFHLLLVLLVLSSLACRAVIPDGNPGGMPDLAPAPVTPALETPAGEPSTLETTPPAEPTGAPATRTAPAPETPAPVLEQAASAASGSLRSPDGRFSLRLHPDGPLYVGDLVSLEVVPSGPLPDEAQVAVEVEEQDTRLGPVAFARHGIGGRRQATFMWGWDTRSLAPGDYTLSISVTPGGAEWQETVSLLPAGQVPPPEPDAHWAVAESDCCLVYYITGTEAERDLETLLEMIDEQAEAASQRLGTTFEEPLPITFLPRVLGHGGFASDEIAVTYLDRNYAGTDFAIVLHHEMIHLLDSRKGGKFRPTMLVEGLAVYLSGGHFKPEPLLPRAAALLAPSPGCARQGAAGNRGGAAFSPRPAPCGLGWYVPLEEMADDFYQTQHETGYLEAAALIEYMVQKWGWEAFEAFYRDIERPEVGGHSAAIDAALRRHFDLSLAQLDREFQAALGAQTMTAVEREDVRLVVTYYNTVRRYQQVLDPSAYFLNAWIPNAKEMRERKIVADYLRRPQAPENVALEGLLHAAGDSLRAGDLAETQRLLQAVNAALDVFEKD